MMHDEDVDELLRQSFDGPVPDAGFSDRVMQHVRRRRRESAWTLVIYVLAGAVTCWLSLSASSFWHAAWRDWFTGAWSTSTVIMLVMMSGLSLLALGWGLTEADDH